jgi:CheY-like chemotaxis protein
MPEIRAPAKQVRDAGAAAAADEVSALVKNLGPQRETVAQRRVVLWVDDNPDNNVIERQSMAAYNIEFVLARSTREAVFQLQTHEHGFDAIVSDMGRPPDPRAGYTLLDLVRSGGNHTPFFIYAGSRDPSHVAETLRRGAQGTTNRGDELLTMLLQALKLDR